MKNATANRAERPDKALFNAIMGVFFLLFAVAPSYWAVYNYGEYRRTTDFIEKLKEGFSKNNSPEAGQEYSERITVFNSRADRYRLEMLLSGVGGLVLFGIALILFKKAFSASKRKNFYEKVDLRSIPMPNAPIKIENENIYGGLFWVILLFFSGIFLLTTYQSFTNPFITTENAIIRTSFLGVPLFLFVSVFLFLMVRAKKNVVKMIDNSGITRGDGRHFAWQNFCGVVQQIAFNRRTQRKYTWRVELAFVDGETAWLIPNRIKNAQEVFDYVAQLPSAVLKSQ